MIRQLVYGMLADIIINHLQTTMLPPKCIGVHNGQSCRNNATHGPRCAIHHRRWMKDTVNKEVASVYDAFRMEEVDF